MFSFFRKKSESDIPSLNGFTDWQCHILPGVDDGVRSMDETLEILKQYEAAGVKEVWFTPHIMEDIPNTPDSLRARFNEVLNTYSGSLKLHLGAENMMDNLFDERFESGDLLPIGENGEYLLVETSYFNPPMGMNDTLERIKKKGYTPILAHPERYLYMGSREYEELKAAGVKFQLNILSLLGYYGKEVREKARRIAKQGMYDFYGTDLHSVRMLEWLQNNK